MARPATFLAARPSIGVSDAPNAGGIDKAVTHSFRNTFRAIALGGAALLLAATPLAAQKTKDQLIAIQRELALVQEAQRQNQAATAERVAGLEALIKQNLEAVSRLNQAVAVIERAVNKQTDEIMPPVTRTAAKADALADQFAGLRDAVEESNSMITKLQREVDDIKTHLTTLPPPGSMGMPGEEGFGEDGGDSIFTGGFTDYNRGEYEIAEAQFNDYLRLYPNGSSADEAQYYLGAIAYNQGDFEKAVSEFDLVIERYPVGSITPEAHFKKAMSLEKLGRTDEARNELQSIVDRFPNSTIRDNAEGLLERLRAEAGKPSPLRR